jgi:hypothetical protein
MASLRVAWGTALFLAWKVYEGPGIGPASKSLTKYKDDKDKGGEQN